jgi:hypothetical protein
LSFELYNLPKGLRESGPTDLLNEFGAFPDANGIIFKVSTFF